MNSKEPIHQSSGIGYNLPIGDTAAIDGGLSVLKEELRLAAEGEQLAQQSLVGWCLPRAFSQFYTGAFFDRFLECVSNVEMQIRSRRLRLESVAQVLAFNAIVEYAEWWVELQPGTRRRPVNLRFELADPLIRIWDFQTLFEATQPGGDTEGWFAPRQALCTR